MKQTSETILSYQSPEIETKSFFYCMKAFHCIYIKKALGPIFEIKKESLEQHDVEKIIQVYFYQNYSIVWISPANGIFYDNIEWHDTWKITLYVHQTDQNLEPPLSQDLTVQVKRDPQSRYSSHLNNAHKSLSADTVCQEWVMAVSWIGHESSVCVMRKDNTILPLNTLQDNFTSGSNHDKETQWFMMQTCSSM